MNLNLINLINIYKALNQTSREYTFFSRSYKIFNKIRNTLSNKTSFNKYQKAEKRR